MNSSPAKTSRFRMLAVLTLAAAALSACTPEPDPTPTAAFASEEEAFAAAEETYRAYLVAAAERASGINAASLEDYLVGEAFEADVQAQRALKDQGVTIVGASTVESFNGVDADINGSVAAISAEICVDISGSRVQDEHGDDVTPADRPTRANLSVKFSGDAEKLLISSSLPAGDSEC